MSVYVYSAVQYSTVQCSTGSVDPHVKSPVARRRRAAVRSLSWSFAPLSIGFTQPWLPDGDIVVWYSLKYTVTMKIKIEDSDTDSAKLASIFEQGLNTGSLFQQGINSASAEEKPIDEEPQEVNFRFIWMTFNDNEKILDI